QYILSQPPGYAVARDAPLWVDVWAFEDLLEAAGGGGGARGGGPPGPRRLPSQARVLAAGSALLLVALWALGRRLG
ncbi:MAG: hypothetical protein N0A03_10500, partial [Anaerolineae bacterium]|nr:hypothetical protein [Anaerolineae bacterium]